MAEDKFSLHVDDDWKKQAQEEKKRLAEQEAKAKAAAPAPAPAGVIGGTAPTTAAPRAAARGGREREIPEASFTTLIQSVVTQILYYLGDLGMRGQEPMVNLDMAKHHLDTLTLLEEKTKNNLSTEEQEGLDAALYETRMRFVSVASRLAELP